MQFKKANQFSKEQKNEDGFEGMTANWLWTADDGMEHFAMRMMEFEPGGHTSLHDHLEEHQFFFLAGEPVYVDGNGNELQLAAGDTLYCPPNEEHQIRNGGKSVMKMICMIPILPGGNGKITTHAPGKKKKAGC